MKRFIKFIFYVFIFFVIIIGTLNFINSIYDKKLKDLYYDTYGNVLSVEKNQGLSLQKMSLDENNNLLIFGSSELSTTSIPSHPSNIFNNNPNGFQVNLIGRGYSQSIIHAINLQALGANLKNKKIVIIISPQWFDSYGLKPENLDINLSELQFYELMFNRSINKATKLNITNRLDKLTNNTNHYSQIKLYSFLYSKNNIVPSTLLKMITPYYKFKYKLLVTKDKIQAYNELKNHKNSVPIAKSDTIKFDWNKQLKIMEGIAVEKTNSNDFKIENNYYNAYIKDSLTSFKDSYGSLSFSESPEYGDLKILLDTCKSLDIKPLFISVPVHGQWYDYCGFPKEKRADYYKKVNNLISSYNFNIADFSNHEYDDYFLSDIMHLGWKGWIYVDEAIDKFYNEPGK